MPSVVHVVTTGNFAGVERYVCNAARETSGRSWDVIVVGGSPERMPEALRPNVRWLPGATAVEALRSLARVGRTDVCHSHMTIAEAVSLTARPAHRSPVVTTRHFAAPRGASRAGRLLSPWIARRVAREIAVSDFVARHLERPPDAVIRNGVPLSPCLWRSSNRVVLVLQRLEPEKDTLTALRAWQASRLVEEGWTMRVVGDGSERPSLEAWVAAESVEGVTFVGWVRRVADELAAAGVLLAPGFCDSFGLAVVEAMAAGVPVVACAAGGHLETVGRLPTPTMFPSGDIDSAAAALRSFLPETARLATSDAGRLFATTNLSLSRNVDLVLAVYEEARARTCNPAVHPHAHEA